MFENAAANTQKKRFVRLGSIILTGKAWHEIGMHALMGAKSETELFDVIAKLALDLGFPYCAYGMRMPLPLTNRKTVLMNNYPDSWQKRYAEMNYLTLDPTVAHGLTSTRPLAWSDVATQTSHDFWEDAASHGLKSGWAQSSFDAQGAVGMLTMSRPDEDLNADELGDKALKMSWLVQAAHESLATFIAKRTPQQPVQLTSREIDVLRWTAEGKTSGDVGQIMNISERTVNFHVNNAIEKLNVANKTAAVIKALLLHLL